MDKGYGIETSRILFYGCHLWECENLGVAWLINSAFCKGVRRRLGLGKFESIHDGFQEVAVRPKTLKLNFLQRAATSINYLAKGFVYCGSGQVGML